VIQEQELAEQTESEGRRVPKEEGVLEVDAKISLERERILQQETLIKKVNANPGFIYDQGITRLKNRVYTRLDKAGNPRTGYKSGFGDVPALLYSNQALIDAEFRSEDFIDFPMPGPKDKRAKKPFLKDMSDEEYAEDFQFVAGCFSELYGEELVNYLRVNQDNHELRKRFVLTLENGDNVFDCSLREPFNSKLIIEKIKKRWSELEG
ncbi:GIP, partial [Symbiodinium pilosum]